MLRVYAAILFGEQYRDAAHDLVRVLLEHLVTVFARERWQGEMRACRDSEVAFPQAFQISQNHLVFRARDGDWHDGAIQLGRQVRDPRLGFDQRADAATRPFWGNGERVSLFHQMDEFSHGLDIGVVPVNEDKVKIFSQPVQEPVLLPLFRDGDVDVPAVERVEGHDRVQDADVVGGQHVTVFSGEILVTAHVHAGDETQEEADQPAQEVTHFVFVPAVLSGGDDRRRSRDTFRAVPPRDGT